MEYLYSKSNHLDDLTSGLDSACEKNPGSLLLLVANKIEGDAEKLTKLLNSLPCPIFGGIFPGLIIKDRLQHSGYLLLICEEEHEVINIPELSEINYIQKKLSQSNDIEPHPSCLTLINGISPHITQFIETLYGHLSSDITYFGGGCGNETLDTIPCIIANEGLHHGAQITLMNRPATISVKHGWEKLAGPFIITKSQNNVIDMIDFQPAFDCYKDAILQDTNTPINASNFFEIAKSYPFGIQYLHDEVIVRDPIKLQGDSLICIGDIPENTMVYILKGEKDKLINAAIHAANSIIETTKLDKEIDVSIIFDCISRSLILESNFEKELHEVYCRLADKTSCIFGACTIGEIANEGSIRLEFYNKTLVISVIRGL